MSELPAAPASGRAPVDPSTISLSAHSRGLLAASAAAPPFAATPLPAQRSAREDAGGRILHGQAAREGDVAVDPRYERALEVDRRRREFRLVK